MCITLLSAILYFTAISLLTSVKEVAMETEASALHIYTDGGVEPSPGAERIEEGTC